MIKPKSLAEKAVLMAITLHGPSIRRKVGSDQVEVDTDKSLLHVSKDILDSDEVRAVWSCDRAFKDSYLRRRAFPSLVKDSVFLLPLALLPEVDRKSEEFQARRLGLVAEAVAVYPRQVQEGVARLRALGDRADYPSQATYQAAWGVDISYLSLGTPGELGEELFRREQGRAEARWRAAEDQIRAALLTSFAELVDRMVIRLSDREDGKRKAIREEGIARLEDFLATFEKRNIVSYGELAVLVRKARGVLRGVGVEALKEDGALRTRVRTGFAEVQAAMEPMVAALPIRRVVLERSEEDAS